MDSFRVLARALAGLLEDGFSKPRSGIVQNLDVCQKSCGTGRPEKGPDVEPGMSTLHHGTYVDNWFTVLLCEERVLLLNYFCCF